MSDVHLAKLLIFLADNDGASSARLAKQLALSQSELLRLLSALGNDSSVGGLGLVEAREEGSRRRIFLSERGRDWLATQA